MAIISPSSVRFEPRVLSRLTVMDHLWQIRGLGPPAHEMLEAYTTLGYLAAATSRSVFFSPPPPMMMRGRCSGWGESSVRSSE